jgi:hypothetical protein
MPRRPEQEGEPPRGRASREPPPQESPSLPALYVAAGALIALTLLVYKTQTTWPGLAIVLTGIPVYFLWRRLGAGRPTT